MNVTVRDEAGTRHVGILGDCMDAADAKALLAALGGHGQRGLELTLYDARTLPAEVLERLLDLADGSRSLKLYVYHHYLLYHLMRLGLPAIGVFPVVGASSGPEVRAVVLGGSADSLDKVLAIVEALPPCNAAFFIVQHILEEKPNYLDKLLKARTELSVEMPQNMTEIAPGTIYVAPPGHQMKVAHGQVYLTRDRKVNYARPSIDVLFESVATEYGEHALAVLLCGYGKDGVAGLTAIKKRGGRALVLETASCEARDLTDAGIASGSFDHVLSLSGLRCFVASALAGRNPECPRGLIDLLLEAVFARYGYDYRNYQPDSLQRRVEHLRGLLGLPDFFSLQREVLTDPEIFERLFLELSINVTAFFRHPEQFRALREKVLPYLDSFSHIKIWSAGCADGKEAYSLAILLDELGMLDKAQIFATDINPYQLVEARNGLYPVEKLEEGQRNYALSGGQARLDGWLDIAKGHVRMAPHLQKHVLFYSHSLAHDGPFNEFQLIVCRNVLIYFHLPLQERVMDLFSRSLHQDGFLVLGPTEGLAPARTGARFAPYLGHEKIYRSRSETP